MRRPAPIKQRNAHLALPPHPRPHPRNIECLHQEHPPLFEEFMRWFQQRGSTVKELQPLIAAVVEPQVAAALLQLRSEAAAGGFGDEGAAAATGPVADAASMLLVALTERAAAKASNAAAASEAAPPLSVSVFCKWMPASYFQEQNTAAKVRVKEAASDKKVPT